MPDLERAVFQQFVLDNLGNVQPDSQVTVRNASDDTIATIYPDLTSVTPKANPFNVGASALARFYAEPGRYNIRFWKDGKEANLENVEISSKAHRLDLNKSTGAELVAYDPTVSGLNVFDVQAALDKTVGNISAVEIVATENKSAIKGLQQPKQFELSDGITSWWAQPTFVNNGSYSHFAYSGGRGDLIYTLIDNNNGGENTYIVDTDNFSSDDHNTGAVSVGGGRVFAVWPGRTVNASFGSSQSFYFKEWQEGAAPPSGPLNEISIGRDYPASFNIDDQFILFGRVTQTAGQVQYNYRLQSWPYQGFGQLSALFQSNTYSWPYLASRRSGVNKNVINIALGFHPVNEVHSSVYVGVIERDADTGEWLIKSAGVTVANLTTGAGLPISEQDLELAYDAGANERVRLLNTSDKGFVIASFDVNAGAGTAVYKYVRKVSGVWLSANIVATGEPFEKSAGVQYFGGAHIANNANKVMLTREDSGLWIYEEYTTTETLSAFTLQRQHRSRTPDGMTVVVGRPLLEDLADDSWSPSPERVDRAVVFAGRYNPEMYQDFNTSLVTIERFVSSWVPTYGKSNGANISSNASLALGHRSAVVAANASFCYGELTAVFASSGADMYGSRKASVASTTASTGVKANYINACFMGSSSASIDGSDSAIVGSRECDIYESASVAEFSYGSFIGGSYQSSTDAIESAILASRGVSVSSRNNAAIACFGGAVSSGSTGDFSPAAMIGSKNSTSGDYLSFVAGSVNSSASNQRAVSVGNNNANVTAADSGAYNSQDSSVTGARSVLIGAKGVSQSGSNKVGSGYAATGTSSANRTWEFDSATGDLLLAGTVTSNNVFADIAKMIKNGEGKEIPPGYLLTLIGDKVYKAQQGEKVDAVVAATPSIVNGDTQIAWQGRWLRDEWGRKITHTISMVKFGDDEGLESSFKNIPDDAVKFTVQVPIENPDYDPTIKQIPRSERPDEWVKAGVHGMVRTRINDTITQSIVDAETSQRKSVFIEPSSVNGIGKIAQGKTKLQVMKIEKEFEINKGYGVALCLLT